MKPGEEAPFEGGVSSPGPSFPEAFDWRGGRAEGVRSGNVLKTRFLALSISVPPSP